MKITAKLVAALIMSQAATTIVSSQIPSREVAWDSHSLILDGKRVMPVMGEIHYSRVPASEWPEAIRKMREGGVTLVATYVFWNHIEEEQGVYNWSGNRSLRAFLEACKAENMPVALRIGPFCHGEARNGGIPDWVFASGCKSRTEDSRFLKFVEDYYRQIFTQLQGLQWKDGGPVIACQFDNEYRGHGSYLMALKKMALEIGFDLPLYTRTGWPELKTPVPFGEMIPLYGDYADGFWERSIKEGAGNYYKAFNFKAFRSSTAIASEQIQNQTATITKGDEQYPFFTCELGGGMATAYHRRPYVYPLDAYSLAVVKLGSGSNLLGYYMYHGGTNPVGKNGYLNEHQRTPATNYNDMPVLSYDFQAPLGEFGQPYPHYYSLRKLHMFMQDFGDVLAPMQASFPSPQNLKQYQDSTLRWSVRQAADSGFVFVNNYERFAGLKAKSGVQFSVGSMSFPTRPITIPESTVCIFPFNIAGIKYATAQIVARRNGNLYLEQIPGIATEIALKNGKILRNVKAKGPEKPVADKIYLLTSEQAEKLFLNNNKAQSEVQKVEFSKVKDCSADYRQVPMGVNKAAEAPVDSDFVRASEYEILLPEHRDGLLEISYRGDVARLYCDGVLIDDNFYYGRPFVYAMRRIPAQAKKLTLKVLPFNPSFPVYLPAEASREPGESVQSIVIRK